MARTVLLLLLVVVVTMTMTTTTALWTGSYVPLGKKCDPAQQNGGVANSNEEGKVCFPGSQCDPQSKICDCADSDDGLWKRTFQKNDCRLLPNSKCVRNVDQDYYRCVDGAKCTQTRKGQDVSKCPADAPCDIGDYQCICESGNCLSVKVKATPQ